MSFLEVNIKISRGIVLVLFFVPFFQKSMQVFNLKYNCFLPASTWGHK